MAKTFEQHLNAAKQNIQDMGDQNKLDGSDLPEVKQFDIHMKALEEHKTSPDYQKFKTDLLNLTTSMLKSGYTINSKKDYEVFQKILKYSNVNIKVPNFEDIKLATNFEKEKDGALKKDKDGKLIPILTKVNNFSVALNNDNTISYYIKGSLGIMVKRGIYNGHQMEYVDGLTTDILSNNNNFNPNTTITLSNGPKPSIINKYENLQVRPSKGRKLSSSQKTPQTEQVSGEQTVTPVETPTPVATPTPTPTPQSETSQSPSSNTENPQRNQEATSNTVSQKISDVEITAINEYDLATTINELEKIDRSYENMRKPKNTALLQKALLIIDKNPQSPIRVNGLGIQSALGQYGPGGNGIDGQYGEGTINAVKAFQEYAYKDLDIRTAHQKNDGKAGVVTVAEILNSLQNIKNPTNNNINSSSTNSLSPTSDKLNLMNAIPQNNDID